MEQASLWVTTPSCDAHLTPRVSARNITSRAPVFRRIFAHMQLMLLMLLGAILLRANAPSPLRGPGPAARLAQVPPGPESGQVERPRRQPPAAGPTRGRLSAGGSAGLRPGRNPGAPLGPRTVARGIYRVPCAAAAPPWSGAAACAGSASACSRPCPEPRGYGPCPCSPCWPPEPAGPGRRARSHKKITDWARQARLQLARWLPGRQLICLGNSGYAVLALLALL